MKKRILSGILTAIFFLGVGLVFLAWRINQATALISIIKKPPPSLHWVMV